MDATAKPGFRGMKGLKKQRRIQVILLAFVAIFVATGLIGYAMQDGINFFRSPTQVVEKAPAPACRSRPDRRYGTPRAGRAGSPPPATGCGRS